MKTNKAHAKRIKVTKNGKLLVRKKGQNHYNAKEGGNVTRAKRRVQTITLSAPEKKRFLANL